MLYASSTVFFNLWTNVPGTAWLENMADTQAKRLD